MEIEFHCGVKNQDNAAFQSVAGGPPDEGEEIKWVKLSGLSEEEILIKLVCNCAAPLAKLYSLNDKEYSAKLCKYLEKLSSHLKTLY